MHEQISILSENFFTHGQEPSWEQIPSQDELFVPAWEEYIRDIPQKGTLEALKTRLVQLNFPVQEGMSSHPEYVSATTIGTPVVNLKAATGICLEQPANLNVYLYQTMAGRIPVIETCHRHDFETLVRVFSHHNEPVPIPASMGACMIMGYNNWDRVNRYKQECGENFSFEQMIAHKEVYQDRFFILTNSEYSGIPADMLGLTPDKWRQLSMLIRKEHEATHYYTRRHLGSARNHLLDEFIADYMGIVAAAGEYRADWFLCFMGLENYPEFRSGGRLTNYLKNIELSAEAFDELKTCIKNAAENIEKISAKNKNIFSGKGKYHMLMQLSKTTLAQLAAVNADFILFD